MSTVHGQVVITITANVPLETGTTLLSSEIEAALEAMPYHALENVDVREIEDARTVYNAGGDNR